MTERLVASDASYAQHTNHDHMTACILTLSLSNSTKKYLYDPMQKGCSPVTLVPQLEVLTSVRPVEGGGVAVGHPGEALAA